MLAMPGFYQNFRMVLRGTQVFERLRYSFHADFARDERVTVDLAFREVA